MSYALAIPGLKFLAANWKFILGGFAIGFLYIKFDSWLNDYVADQKAQQNQIVHLVQERDQAIQEAISALKAIEEQEAHVKRMELLLEETLKRQDEIRAEAREEKRTFEEHDFEKLVIAKPTLIERLANRATAERMKSFEDAFNDR